LAAGRRRRGAQLSTAAAVATMPPRGCDTQIGSGEEEVHLGLCCARVGLGLQLSRLCRWPPGPHLLRPLTTPPTPTLGPSPPCPLRTPAVAARATRGA
jgi:hypothetical protein